MPKILFKSILPALFLLSGLVLITNCKDKNKPTEDNFKKGELLTNLADNYIIPHYTELQTRVFTLDTKWGDFLLSPSTTTYDEVKSAFLAASEEYQRVKMFNFGPGMTENLQMVCGVFPTDTAQITSQINSGIYDLNDDTTRDTQGFDALDYLFYRVNAMTLIQGSVNTQNYITALIVRMKTKVSNVLSQWQTSYRSTFISGTGTEVTSAFSLLVNSFCRDFEGTKNLKLGYPLGVQNLNTPNPLEFEGKWSGHNKVFLQIAVETSYNIYKGMGTVDGLGFDDYLIAEDRADLDNSIQSRYQYMQNEIATWNDNLQQRLNTNSSSLYNFYNYMQGTVVYLKTDMTSAFSVSITYQDSDGD